MLAPKRVKFRKMMKGRTRGFATRGNRVSFGEFGLMALEPGWISNRQIEAARVALTREMKRGGKVWIYRGDFAAERPVAPPQVALGQGV